MKFVEESLEPSDEDKARNKGKEPLEELGGPMARARTNKAKEALLKVQIGRAHV